MTGIGRCKPIVSFGCTILISYIGHRAIATVLRCQHPQGGFGGGPGQNAHMLANYAAVCSLAIMGFPGPNGGWDQIDRVKMYEWFMSLKQPDGSFLVSVHAEVDMRSVCTPKASFAILRHPQGYLLPPRCGYITGYHDP